MQKNVKNTLFSLLLFSFFFVPQAKADYGIDYCTLVDAEECADELTDLDGFITGLSENSGYEPHEGLSVTTEAGVNYFNFETNHFSIKLPEYDFLLFLENLDINLFQDYLLTASEYAKWDENHDLVPDLLEVYGEYLEEETERYEIKYGLETWWDSDEKLLVYFEDLPYYLYGFYQFRSSEAILVVDVLNEEDTVKATISHELFHGVQDSYMDASLFASDFLEGTATMMQYRAPGLMDLLHLDLEGGASALLDPENSVFANPLDEHAPTYSTFLWYAFLDWKYSNDLIEGILNEYKSMENSLEALVYCDNDNCYQPANHHYFTFSAISGALEKEGVTIEQAYRDFAIQNYDVDDYIDGDYFSGVKILNTHQSTKDSETVGSEDAPFVFGSNYIEIAGLDKKEEPYLHFEFEGDEEGAYYVSFLPVTGTDVSKSRVTTYAVDFREEMKVDFPIDDRDKKVIVVVSPVDISTPLTEGDIFNTKQLPYSYSYQLEMEATPESQLAIPGSEFDATVFKDLPLDHPNSDAILTLYYYGIISGYDDKTFKPENTLNRAELLKILVESTGETPDEATYANCFKDVKTDWYAKYVCYAKEKGWVQGYPDGNFRPGDAVDNVESIKMLLNSQSTEILTNPASQFTDLPENAWYTQYVKTAESLGILEEEGNLYSPGSDKTRAGICENIYRLLFIE